MAVPAVAMVYPGVGRRREEERVCAGFRAQTRSVWDEVVLQEHPLRDELIACWCLKHGASNPEVPCMFYGDRCCSCGEHLSKQ